MPLSPGSSVRAATAGDCSQLLRLWGLLYDGAESTDERPWRSHAREWFGRTVGDVGVARFPVVEVDGEIIATAVGTLELGVPNPYCPQGRTVRLANVITRPDHRNRGHASSLVDDVTAWATSIGADRMDLSATPEGQSIYLKAGFVLTSAPRMKLVLGRTVER